MPRFLFLALLFFLADGQEPQKSPTGLPKNTPCRVLALSGGGDKGAYEAGVVYGLVKNLPAGEAAWDVVTGISAGSINAGAIATFSVGDEDAMADFLLDTARTLTGDDIFKSWSAPGPFGVLYPLGVLYGFFYRSGIFNSEPLLDFMQKKLASRGLTNRKLLVGATSYNSGNLVTWNETLPVEDVGGNLVTGTRPCPWRT